MKRGRSLLWLTLPLLALLFLPSGTASFDGALRADSLVVSQASAVSPLGGLLLETQSGISWGGVVLSAALIEGTIDVSQTEVVVEGAGVTPTNVSQEPVSWKDAALRFVESSLGGRLVVVPEQATVSIQQWSGEIEAGREDRVVPAEASTTRPSTRVPFAGFAYSQPLSGIILVEGDFRIVLWSANASVEHSAGQALLQTGATREQVAASPLPGGQGVEAVERREAHLLVHDGALELPVLSGLQYALVSPVVTAGPQGNIAIQGADGTLLLNSRSLELEGSVVVLGEGSEVEVQPENAVLALRVSGNRDAVTVDGTIVSSPSGPSQTAWIWTVALAVVGLACYGVYLVAVALARRKLDALMREERHSEALSFAMKLNWVPRLAEEVVVARTISLLKLGRVGEARAVVETEPRGRDRPHPHRLFLRARIAGMQGDMDTARRLLVDCLLLAPAFRWQALADPVLAPLARQSSLEGGYA